MHEFLVLFPIRVLVEAATTDPETGKVSVQGVLSVEADGKVAVPIFTDQDFAVRFARSRGFPNAQVGLFEDRIDFGYFLQVQQKHGFSHVCVDPKGIGERATMVSINEALASLSEAIRKSKP
jgi:hypothetical protein